MLGFSLFAMDQAIGDWASALGWPGEPMLRLVLSGVLGGLVGLERELRGRQAGFRTNLLVCLGCTLIMVVSVSFAQIRWAHPATTNLNVDPARLAYGVMAGIGFLGAGVIIKHDGNVRGLTTAAGMWCVSAIGLAAGLGHYVISAFATILVLGALWTLDRLEKLLPRMNFRVITVRRKWYAGVLTDTVKLIQSYKKLEVVDASFERVDDYTMVHIRLSIAFSSKKRYYEFEKDLDQRPDCDLLSSGYV